VASVLDFAASHLREQPMTLLIYGDKASRTHENQMLQAFLEQLEERWADSTDWIFVVANAMWSGAEIDLVCILPSAIIVADFKSYGGTLSGTENGPWQADGVIVKGGRKANPYQQLRDNKFSVLDWLQSKALLPGYANLDGDERHAIAEFSLLWPAFEGAILETAASPSGLVQIGFKLRDAGRLDMARFDVPLAYFRNRYWRDGAFTLEYDGLHLKHFNQRNQKLVRETLSNVPLLPEDVLGGLLLVVYRLRNNLFHGVKWAYGIKGQKPNFQNACVVLMAVMELHEGLN